MKYLCLVYSDPARMKALSKEQREAFQKESMAHVEEFKKSGYLVRANGLTGEVTTLRPRAGKVTVTDGPFVETKEQIGGTFVLEARDLNEAIRVASSHLYLGADLGGGIEVRPIMGEFEA